MSYSSEVMADSPLARYRMNEPSGLVQDSSGNGNHADEVAGTTLPTYSQVGPILNDSTDAGIAFHLGAIDSRFGIPDHATLDFADVFTLEAWIKRNDFSVNEYAIVSKGYTAINFAGGMYIVNNLLYGAQSGIGAFVESTITIPFDGNYYHCVVTKNGTARLLYVNGADVTNTGAQADKLCENNTQKLGISTEYTPGGGDGGRFEGTISEIAIYGTALSPARVLAHYQAAQAFSQLSTRFIGGIGL